MKAVHMVYRPRPGKRIRSEQSRDTSVGLSKTNVFSCGVLPEGCPTARAYSKGILDVPNVFPDK